MKKRDKKRYNILIGLLSVMVCAFIAIGAALGLGVGSSAPAALEGAGVLVESAPSGLVETESVAVVDDAGENSAGGANRGAKSLSDVAPPEAADIDVPEDIEETAAAGVLSATSPIRIAPLSAEPCMWSSSTVAANVDYTNTYVITFQTTASNTIQNNNAGTALTSEYLRSQLKIDGNEIPELWPVAVSGGRNFTLTIPADTLDSETEYKVTISKDFEVLNGDKCPCGADFEFTFTTKAEDAPATSVTAVFLNPAVDGFVGFNPGSSILIAFTGAVDTSTVSDAIVLTERGAGGGGGGGTIVLATLAWSNGNTHLTVTPDTPLKYGANYRLEIRAGMKSTDDLDVDAATVNFTTASFTIGAVSAGNYSKSTGAYEVSFSATNNSGSAKDLFYTIVVRGGRGARPDSGGFVLALTEGSQTGVTGTAQVNETLTIDTSIEINGNIYIDVYVWSDVTGTFINAQPVFASASVVD